MPWSENTAQRIIVLLASLGLGAATGCASPAKPAAKSGAGQGSSEKRAEGAQPEKPEPRASTEPFAEAPRPRAPLAAMKCDGGARKPEKLVSFRDFREPIAGEGDALVPIKLGDIYRKFGVPLLQDKLAIAAPFNGTLRDLNAVLEPWERVEAPRVTFAMPCGAFSVLRESEEALAQLWIPASEGRIGALNVFVEGDGLYVSEFVIDGSSSTGFVDQGVHVDLTTTKAADVDLRELLDEVCAKPTRPCERIAFAGAPGEPADLYLNLLAQVFSVQPKAEPMVAIRIAKTGYDYRYFREQAANYASAYRDREPRPAPESSPPPTDPTTGQARELGILDDGDPGARPGLPPDVVRKVLRLAFEDFGDCYEPELIRNPKLGGRVALRFQIELDGKVSNVRKDPTTTLPSFSVVQCMKDVVSHLTFPEPEGRVVKVLYPVWFKAGPVVPDGS